MKHHYFMDPQFDEPDPVCSEHKIELIIDDDDSLFCSECEPERYQAWLEKDYARIAELNSAFCSKNISMGSLLHSCVELLAELSIPEEKKGRVENLVKTINKFI